MKQKTRIVLIGAGSREFARALVHDLVLEKPLYDVRALHVVMVDLDAAHLTNLLFHLANTALLFLLLRRLTLATWRRTRCWASAATRARRCRARTTSW